MKGFDTGHKDQNGNHFQIGSKVQWYSNGELKEREIILKDGCMIGIEIANDFLLVKDFPKEFKVADGYPYLNGGYNPTYGDDRICKCGHSYYRHFDSWEDMDPIGCKYCPCYEFEEKTEEKVEEKVEEK